MIFWGIFYIITTFLLAYFFIKEKKVMEYIKAGEDKFLASIDISGSDRDRLRGKALTIVAIIVSLIFFFLIDRTPDPLIKLKNIGIYGVFFVNLGIYVLRRQHEYILLVNLVMMFLGKLMFNILDLNFYIYLIINVVISAALIYLFRDGTKEPTGTEEEKRRKSTLGKAVARINVTILAIVLVGTIQSFYVGNYVIPSGSMEPTILIKDRVFSNMAKYRFTKPKVGDIIAFKEPVNNQVMYTKRITGAPGTTLEIVSGRLEENGKLNEILDRPYEPEGVFGTNKIYVPKKGDRVKLDKIIMIGKLWAMTETGEKIVGTDYVGYNNGENYAEISGQEFLERIKTNKDFRKIIVNETVHDENDTTKDVLYTFTLKVEGRDELVLPILDLRDDDKIFNKLLNGETITLDQDYYVAMGDNTQNSYDSRYFGYVGENRIAGELVLRWWPLNRAGLL